MRDERRKTGPDVGTAATASDTGDPAPAGEGTRAVAAPAGAIGGAVGGAAAGTVVLGPVGAMVGAIAGAVGGGWSGLAAGAATHYTAEHDHEYRGHYESDHERLADRSYDVARPAYQLGHLAARNPDYANRDFESIEADLRRGWGEDARTRFAEWDVARRYAREAYTRERARRQGRMKASLDLGGTESHQRPSFADPIPDGDPDGVAGEREIPGRGTSGAT